MGHSRPFPHCPLVGVSRTSGAGRCVYVISSTHTCGVSACASARLGHARQDTLHQRAQPSPPGVHWHLRNQLLCSHALTYISQHVARPWGV